MLKVSKFSTIFCTALFLIFQTFQPVFHKKIFYYDYYENNSFFLIERSRKKGGTS